MTALLTVPIEKFYLPFDSVWKRLSAHLILPVSLATAWSWKTGFDAEFFFRIVAVFFLHEVSQAFIHTVVYHKLNEDFPWIEQTRKRIISSIIFHLAATYFNFFLLFPLLMAVGLQFPLGSAFNIVVNAWSIAFVATVVGIVFGMTTEFFRNWKNSLVAEERLQTEMMSYKYESLRNQVNPNFLLESFGGLKNLIIRDPVEASDFIHKMSALYRHVLDIRDKEFISLAEELHFLDLYLALVQVRFKVGLDVRVTVGCEPDDLIIPLTLQLLVEQLVERGRDAKDACLPVCIERTGEDIIVSQRGVVNASNSATIRKGLSNLEQQYDFYSRKPMRCVETGDSFLVFIPVLKQA
jgi:two-component system, LytTR family, sensor kinase